jgi:integrase
MLSLAADMFGIRREAQAADGRSWAGSGRTTGSPSRPGRGRPVEPRNLVRSVRRICVVSGTRVIKLHHLRHTTPTQLKNLGVTARDAQLILGHSRLAVTQEIDTREDRQAQHDALTKISRALRHDGLLHRESSSMGVNYGCQRPLARIWRTG